MDSGSRSSVSKRRRVKVHYDVAKVERKVVSGKMQRVCNDTAPVYLKGLFLGESPRIASETRVLN